MKLAAIAAAIMLLFSCSEPMKQGKVVFISVASLFVTVLVAAKAVEITERIIAAKEART